MVPREAISVEDVGQRVQNAVRCVLVVDDEAPVRHMLRLVLERGGYTVIEAIDGEHGLEQLANEPQIDLVLSDVRMPRLDGMGFLERALLFRPDLLVVMMSAYGSRETAFEAVRAGAQDFVSKPFHADEVLFTLQKLEERERLSRENQRLRVEVARDKGLDGLVGANGGLSGVAAVIRKVAAVPVTVLITGESGTGKELVAQAIHRASPRMEGPFVAINCGAIPENLLESELFGHERGAFTGAVRAHAGLFEQASGGTLLLDEVGDMPLALQVKLLRVLEEGTVRRLAGQRELPVDVRLLAATSRDLALAVREGRFREDLYYRLNVVHLPVPTLRERQQDVPLLVEHFVRRFAQASRRPVPRISSEAMAWLTAQPWPGNVRQIENACQRATLLADGEELGVEDFSPALDASLGAVSSVSSQTASDDLSIKRNTAELEHGLIQRALEQTGGNRTKAAAVLEISYKALLYKIRDYGIDA